MQLTTIEERRGKDVHAELPRSLYSRKVPLALNPAALPPHSIAHYEVVPLASVGEGLQLVSKGVISVEIREKIAFVTGRPIDSIRPLSDEPPEVHEIFHKIVDEARRAITVMPVHIACRSDATKKMPSEGEG